MVRPAVIVLGLLTAGAPAAGKPNVLFVLTDDQRFDTVRALGNAEIDTPTLDRLAARGFVFSNAYCQGSMVPAVCTPSRTMLLTGKSLFRIPDPKAKTYDGPTLGKTFADAGYATLCVSKPGNSFRAAHEQFGQVIHIPHSGAATNQKCADAVIECVGSPAVVGEGLEMCRDGGKYLVLGHYGDAGSAPINPHVITRKQLTVYGSWASEPRHMEKALEFLKAQGNRFPFGRLVSHRFPLDATFEALQTTAKWASSKSVVVPMMV